MMNGNDLPLDLTKVRSVASLNMTRRFHANGREGEVKTRCWL